MANAHTTETLLVGFGSFAFTLWDILCPESRWGSVRFFQPFVTSKQYICTSSPSMISSSREPLVTCIIVQISHHNRSEATGTAADNCHNVCPHLRFLREEMLLCCQRSFEVWEHIERKMASLMSLGNLSPASSWCLCSRLSQLRMIFLLCLWCSVRHYNESVHNGFRANACSG